jgi:hypothetical protein
MLSLLIVGSSSPTDGSIKEEWRKMWQMQGEVKYDILLGKNKRAYTYLSIQITHKYRGQFPAGPLLLYRIKAASSVSK